MIYFLVLGDLMVFLSQIMVLYAFIAALAFLATLGFLFLFKLIVASKYNSFFTLFFNKQGLLLNSFSGGF